MSLCRINKLKAKVKALERKNSVVVKYADGIFRASLGKSTDRLEKLSDNAHYEYLELDTKSDKVYWFTGFKEPYCIEIDMFKGEISEESNNDFNHCLSTCNREPFKYMKTETLKDIVANGGGLKTVIRGGGWPRCFTGEDELKDE